MLANPLINFRNCPEKSKFYFALLTVSGNQRPPHPPLRDPYLRHLGFLSPPPTLSCLPHRPHTLSLKLCRVLAVT